MKEAANQGGLVESPPQAGMGGGLRTQQADMPASSASF